MWSRAGVLCLLVAHALCITRDQLYPNGPWLDAELPKGSEVATPEIPLKVPIQLYGESYESVFVNNFGVLSFRSDIPTFLNTEFPLPYASIAAFYSNIDTSESGTVYYRESNDPKDLQKAEEIVQSNFNEYFDFQPTSVFIATWSDVSYTDNTNPQRRNTFQAVVISNGTETFVELLYPETTIQWIQRETQQGHMPDAKAQAGFIAEDGRVYTLRGSGSHQIRNIMSWTNIHEPGKYVFRVGNIPQEGSVAVPDQYNQSDVDVEEEFKTCALSGPSLCHYQAQCVDYKDGTCCECNEGFYGNGKFCIQNDLPLRVNGKLNGVLNEIPLSDVDLQAYVVVADGRSYAALSQAPAALGHSLLLLNVLGGVTGWLFAKPVGNAKNGYQLTGSVFNHTAEIFFPGTSHRVIINQEYLGHDVFDQITLEADVRGSLPIVTPDSQLELAEYDEQYTFVDVGLVRSETNRTLRDKITGEKFEARISQTFSFNTCQYAPDNEEDRIPLTLKVSKVFLRYENKTNIVRYGLSNKILPLGNEDPCVKGREQCGRHSNCVATSDSFTCVCQSGFTSTYSGEKVDCIDIDECTYGPHNCHVNSDCYNYEGGFECRCREGFEGDGINCAPVSKCKSIRCDPNAKCVERYGEDPVCVCDTGYTGPGEQCWAVQEANPEPSTNVCTTCSPDADCVQRYQSYACVCRPGFVGDGNYCTQEIRSTTVENSAPISESEYNQTFVLPQCTETECICPQGYGSFTDDTGNQMCQLDDYENGHTSSENHDHGTSMKCSGNQDCPPNAFCTYSQITASYECACYEGYVGDGYECVERTSPSCQCGANAHCTETSTGDVLCICDRGYHGDGHICQPNFSCTDDSHCELNAECRPDALTGGQVCQCVEGYTKDQNDACILEVELCNGAVCAEHATCLFDMTENVHFCHCDPGYEGIGIEKCTPEGHTCDVINDCSPEADCVRTEYSYECVCREGFIGDGYTCNPEPNCRYIPSLCHPNAACIKKQDGYICDCNSGYLGNGSYCQLIPKPPGNFLIASDGSFVYKVPFHANARDIATPINTDVDKVAVAIGVDCQTGRIYWSDIVSNAIKSAAYDGSNFEVFLGVDVRTPEGISVDHASRNIFWTDARKQTIEVANLDTKLRKTLFTKDGISNPRGIVVHSRRGKIFWSDWYRKGPKIEWSNMDGSQREVFLSAPDVNLPNSLTVDASTDRLCYADAGLHSVECVNIDTRQRETIVAECTYPFGLAINDDVFYWTDWRTLKIEYFNNRSNERSHLPIATAARKLFGVAVAPQHCEAAASVCQYRNGNCNADQICLPNGRGGRTCVTGA